jgi:TPP-dependent pyruvate/acetoin dehydrogenase alpha subunit
MKITKDFYLTNCYKFSSLSREFDNSVFKLVKNKFINFPVYLSAGQEYVASSIASAMKLKKIRPLIFGQHRCHSIYLSFGGSLEKLILEFLGKKDGCSFGKGGSLGLQSKKINMFGHDGFMGSNASIGVGACFASKKPTIIFLGDAAVEEDYVLSSIGWVDKMNLPILFVVEDNDYAVLTKKADRRNWKIVNVAKSFGLDSCDIKDDPQIILKKLKNFEFKRPALINIRTNRLYWHSGAGIDDKNAFDRLKKEGTKIGQRLSTKIANSNKKKIKNLWLKHSGIQLEKLH